MPRDLGVLTQARAGDEGSTLTGQLVALFAVAVGIIILNVFAPQILVGQIAPELGLGAAAAGLVATRLGSTKCQARSKRSSSAPWVFRLRTSSSSFMCCLGASSVTRRLTRARLFGRADPTTSAPTNIP